MHSSSVSSRRSFPYDQTLRSSVDRGMKGAWQSKIVGKELSLVIIALLCATIVLWSWERNPLVTNAVRPKDKDLLQIRSEPKIEDNQVKVTVNEIAFHNSETSEADEIKSQTTEIDIDNERQSSDEVMTDSITETRDSSENREACDFGKGKWVVDERWPLYSGFGCKQWLSQMWACRVMRRLEFSYENLRWEPKNCPMKKFDGNHFLERMKGKLIAIVGDSLGRQQFQSLMCMITAGEERPDVADVGHEYGLVKAKGAVRPDGWAYRFPSTNTTVLYYWSACLCDLDPINKSNPLTEYAMHLDRPPKFLQRFLPLMDVLVLNTGHHWNRGKINGNRWVMYVGGVQNTNKRLAAVSDAKNFTIHSIVKWVNSQLPNHPRLQAFYRSISPRHFVNGDWNTGGSCDNENPTSVGKEVLVDESTDIEAAHAVKGTGVQLLDITALSKLRDEGHISKYSSSAAQGVQDCLHWCLPGVPDTWNEILFAKVFSTLQSK